MLDCSTACSQSIAFRETRQLSGGARFTWTVPHLEAYSAL